MSKIERFNYELIQHSTIDRTFPGNIVTKFSKRTYKAEIVAYYKNEFKGNIVGVFFEGKFFLRNISGNPETRRKLLNKLNRVIGKVPVVRQQQLKAQQTMDLNIYKKLFK